MKRKKKKILAKKKTMMKAEAVVAVVAAAAMKMMRVRDLMREAMGQMKKIARMPIKRMRKKIIFK
jgi:hypothetical protein